MSKKVSAFIAISAILTKCSFWPHYNLNVIFNPAKLWKYTNDKKLINHDYESAGSYLNKHWILPEENEEGYIEASDEVLGVVDLTDSLSDVELEAKIIPISDGQKWYRSAADKNGWFVLTNPHSGKVILQYYSDGLCIDGNFIITGVIR